ncbi:TerC family protein [Lederbergia galactosidilytica]|uniref:Uncharacterized protein n=1 Tax=Lederbergia galactosidilytica TaxID=217031 RepID=A0A177ZW68_9BACI|nr:hypothetical protein [Lederbergia galactosidilytica]KRG12051.1 hypothetical protein ACA30_20655 [Virgibacillus soli]MBP1913516.1 putative tellurium resistance membrane protein TerC [Lederbergia galactosidilytica]OAK72166.1 hypothetical protein ABB05_08990 [Lederbergia galactosidilytica]
MNEIIKVFFITFISDLDNFIILGAIIRKHPQVNIVLPAAVVLTCARSLYIVVMDTLLTMPVIHVIMGMILLFIALKLVTKSFTNETFSPPFNRSISIRVKVLLLLAATDFLICLDSVVIISELSENMSMAIIGIFLSLLVSLCFLPFIIKIASKFAWINIIAGAFIAQTAVIGMIGDPWLKGWILSLNSFFPNVNLIHISANIVIILVILVGCYSYINSIRQNHLK